jgi:hypothetical protein
MSLLMTKFVMHRKNRIFQFLFQTIRFREFQNMKEEETKLGDLKIQCVLKQEEGLKDIKEPR